MIDEEVMYDVVRLKVRLVAHKMAHELGDFIDLLEHLDQPTLQLMGDTFEKAVEAIHAQLAERGTTDGRT